MKIYVISLLISSAYSFSGVYARPYSSLVYPGAEEKLVYAGYANHGQASKENRMMDFSTVGYKGGGVAIPWVPVVKVLDPEPGNGNDYKRIQAAIDELSAMPLSSAGFRGALLLRAGSYKVSKTLRIKASGIVIRGEGQGPDGTVMTKSGNVKEDFFAVTGNGGWVEIRGTSSGISDAFVPSGSRSFNVDSSAAYRVGDRIIVRRTPNQAWIDILEMGPYGWTPSGYRSNSPRMITAINGNRITVNAPLTNAIEAQYGGGSIYKYHFEDAVKQVGIERLRLKSSFTSDTDEAHAWNAIKFERTEHAWVRQVTGMHFSHSLVEVANASQYVTVEDCAFLDPKSEIVGGRRYPFYVDDACYVLIQRCYSEEGRHDYVTGSRTPGPVVFVDSLAKNTYSDSGPHHRYSEGHLYDNIKEGELHMQNRKSSGSGHGWAGAQIVFWNCEAESLICDTPKAAMNFAIGCVGKRREGIWAPEAPAGFWESHNTPVTPRSLYYKQLEDRLGFHAVKRIITNEQRQGPIWDSLAAWSGDGDPPWLPEFFPVQVDAGEDFEFMFCEENELHATVLYPLPSNYPTTSKWTLVSGPESVTIMDPKEQSTRFICRESGTYVFRYTFKQVDHTDPQNKITYRGSGTVRVTVPIAEVNRVTGSKLNPKNFSSLGAITSSTPAITFDTDSLKMTGGLTGLGELAANSDCSTIAIFSFEDVNFATEPHIIGSRPLIIMSKKDMLIDTIITVEGAKGSHAAHGIGVAGGGNGGDANRPDSTGYPFDGQGLGGSSGNRTGRDDISSAGGGFGGAGGDSSFEGGVAYGEPHLTTLMGGSGAGGSRNKGGGAGGGAIGLVAQDHLEVSVASQIIARGGDGASSSNQLTSGGGSGGAILLRGKTVEIKGLLNAEGGDGGDASGGQLNGGGGGGGRIAVYYHQSYDASGSIITVKGGQSNGVNNTGEDGFDGTVYFGLDDAGKADQWLMSETGLLEVSPIDWQTDFDGDGLAAKLEYALGGSTASDDSHLIPSLHLVGSELYHFRFNRRQTGIDLNDYIVEISTTLQEDDWSPVRIDESLTTQISDPEGYQQVVAPVLVNDNKAIFVRLHVR
ncbi:MAG: hypothetical protein AAGA18_13325 [Verrucomicrobiota bacterium]